MCGALPPLLRVISWRGTSLSTETTLPLPLLITKVSSFKYVEREDGGSEVLRDVGVPSRH